MVKMLLSKCEIKAVYVTVVCRGTFTEVKYNIHGNVNRCALDSDRGTVFTLGFRVSKVT